MKIHLVAILLVANSAVYFYFILAGLLKLNNRKDFQLTLIKLPFIPYRLTSAMSVAVPLVELFVGGWGLIAGRQAAALAAIALLSIFIGFSLLAKKMRLKIKCNCLGNDADENALGLKVVGRNALMMIPLLATVLIGYEGVDWYATAMGICVAFIAISAMSIYRANQKIMKTAGAQR